MEAVNARGPGVAPAAPRPHACRAMTRALLPLAAALAASACTRAAPAAPADPDVIAASGPYAPIAAALSARIEREMRLERIPAVSIAVVDHGRTVWAQGFGTARAKGNVPATANTVYRIGSVSKLFTDIGVMQLVERGELDLDAPLARYLPDFRPANPFGGEITLRELMSHRAGLVREPPTGNYFDSTDAVLAHMVASLNRTSLVYAPGTQTKYSNAGIGTVGFVLEHLKKEPFAAYLKRSVLEPAGLSHSAFAPEPAIAAGLADGRMWTRHGTDFPAPTFQLGMAPAGSMYSTVHDLVRFMQLLIAGGQGPGGTVLQRATLEQMWQPQFGSRFGLGFALDSLDGRRVVGHGGAIYGFATEMKVMPDDSMGVVVVGTKDAVNHVLAEVATAALGMLRAQHAGRPLPVPDSTTAVPAELGRRVAGRWSNGTDTVDIAFRNTSGSKDDGAQGLRRNVVLLERSGLEVQLHLRRLRGDTLMIDDVFATGGTVVPEGNALRIGPARYTRLAVPKPPAVPAAWLPLVGEYGWDYNVLYILERDGAMHALIEWMTDYPLTPVDDSTFRFPDRGLYAGESLVFRKGADGRVTEVKAANVVFPRRAVGPEPGATQLKETPLKPVEELRTAALAATPPAETGDFLPSDLVEVATLDPTIKLDVRYAGTNNFFGAKFYDEPRVFLQRPAAEALVRAHRALRSLGYGLLLHDGYRPWYVTKMFWDGTSEHGHLFVADPSSGSKHNRGAAIDLNLYDLRTGQPIEMVGTYDEMSDRSFPDYPGGTSLQRWHRELLRRTMEAQGFLVTETEWWHFDYGDWARYRIGNEKFSDLRKAPQ